jgi:hypothetical protein
MNNVCYLLGEATHFHATLLTESIQKYMCFNLETLLESRMLDDLLPDLIDQLGDFVRAQQALKSPISRTSKLVNKAMENHADWLAMQDIPQPIVRTGRQDLHRTSPKLSPTGSVKLARCASSSTLPLAMPSNNAGVEQPSHAIDDIFEMDDADVVVPPVLEAPESTMEIPSVPAWKGASSVPRCVSFYIHPINNNILR